VTPPNTTNLTPVTGAVPRLFAIKATRGRKGRVVVSGRATGGTISDRVRLRITIRTATGERRRRTVSKRPDEGRFRLALKVRRLATRRVTLTYVTARKIATLRRSSAKR
jgi:hypothetical protein